MSKLDADSNNYWESFLSPFIVYFLLSFCIYLLICCGSIVTSCGLSICCGCVITSLLMQWITLSFVYSISIIRQYLSISRLPEYEQLFLVVCECEKCLHSQMPDIVSELYPEAGYQYDEMIVFVPNQLMHPLYIFIM